MSVDKLCSEMYKQTGVSWTKRYKKHYGAINRFLKKYDDKFFYNPDVNWVSLRDETTTSASSSADVSQQDKEVPGPSSEPSGTGAENTSGNCEQDQDGKSVHSKELEKQYSGKESAYMLFYRRKSMKRPAAASGNAAYGIPDHMVTEILQENGVLDQLRVGFPKNMTVSDFRAKVSNITGIGEGRLVLRRIVGEDITTKVVSLEGGSGDGETDKLVTGGLTLENLQVKDGDQIVAEDGEGSGPGDPKGDIPDQEVVVDRNISVDACMQCMIKQAGLTGLDWHLRSTNFFGEAGDVLDDGEASLEQSLVNDDSTKPGESVTELFLGEIDISKDATLEDLRLQILTLPGAKDLPVLMPDFMRVRVVEGGQLRQVLRGSQNTLRRMKVTSHSHLAVQIFPHDANISTNQVVLNIQLRDCSTRSYKEAHELVWDTVGGSSAHCLQQAVADLLALPVDGISIAKHFPQRFEWTLLRDNVQQLRSHSPHQYYCCYMYYYDYDYIYH
nr:hypothetical protein BaRGS_006223 [Batillaria attramentaria]